MKRLLALILFSLFLFLTFCPAHAEIRITQAKLISKKINLMKFGIVNISNSGRVVTAYEKISDPKLKQKGTAYKLWIFEFTGKTRDDVKISEVLLPCALLQNAALSPDGKISVITAERGSKFIAVDIAAKKAKVLFEHKKGTPGFRADGGIIQYYDNTHLGAVGYFYDTKDKLLRRAIALIGPSKTGNAIFSLGFDSTMFETVLGDKAKYLEWCDVGKCFFVSTVREKNDQTIEILSYLDNGKIKKIARAENFISMSCGKNTVVYSTAKRDVEAIKKGVKDPERTLKDAVTYAFDVTKDKAPYKISPDSKTYTYIATAKDGSAAIISDINLRALRVNYFYGKKSDNFIMNPIAGLQKTPLSQLRLAPDGKAYVTWDGTQIIWDEIK